MIEEYFDVEIRKTDNLGDIGFWLDANMPNPPMPEPQRWTLGYNSDGSRLGIRFSSSKDATFFTLRWR